MLILISQKEIASLVGPKINTAGTKTVASEWALFGRLLARMRYISTGHSSPVFIILRRPISGNIERLAPGK